MSEPALTLTHREWLAALDKGRVDVAGRALDAELQRLGVPEAARGRLRELIEGVWWSGGDGEGGRSEVVGVIGEVVPIVAGDRAEALLALYIRVVCEAAWDLTWDHGPLLEVLVAAKEAWAGVPPARGSDAEFAIRALLALRVELTLESACSTGDLRTTARAAHDAGELLAREVAAAARAPDSPVASHVVDLLSDQAVYVDAVHAAAAAAADFLDGTGDDLDEALQTLGAAEIEIEDHAFRSELRAHRVAVERLIAARTEDWLRVDEGSIVAMFPFGLRHATQSEVVDAVKTHGATWTLAGLALANNPTGLLLVDDVWRGDDPLKRRYEGTQLDLPDLHLLGRDGQEITARVTITISQLGNHYVRVEIPLEAELPHTLASLVWLAAPEYGDLTEVDQLLVLGEQPEGAPAREGWPRLTGLVQRVLHDLVEELARSGMRRVALSFRPGMYHVVTTVQEASVLPGGRQEEAVPLDLAARIPLLFGSQSICHPIPAGVGSIAFWARYSAPLGSVVNCAGLTDEYLLVSENHTLLASFSSPDYMVATVGQAAEFAASLDGMFAAWQDELSQFYLGLAPHLRRLDSGEDVDLEVVLAELEQAQLRLRQFLTSARVTVLFIGSPALVTSPVMRDTVTQFLDLRHVWTRRTDFTDVAGQALADRVTDLIEAWLRRREAARVARQEEKEKRDEQQAKSNRVRIDTMIAVLTAIGISGVLAMVQTGFALEEWGSVVLVVVVLLLAALVGLVSYRWSQHVGRDGPS